MRDLIRQRLLERGKNKCAYCGSTENLQIDHIIPVSRGGLENENNMQVLCRTCNLKKRNKIIDLDKYFIVDKSPDYILMSRDVPFRAFTPQEWASVITQMFEKNEAYFNEK